MVKVERYVRFYASAVSLMAHGLFGLQLSCGTCKVGRSAPWNQREMITGFGPIRGTISVKQHTLAVSLYSSH